MVEGVAGIQMANLERQLPIAESRVLSVSLSSPPVYKTSVLSGLVVLRTYIWLER
jgi:hypothetical protein